MDALRKAAEQTLEAWSQRDYEIGKYMDTLRDALAQQAEPVKVVQIDDTSTPHGRLATMLAEALGADHPAMADFAAIVLGASPQRLPLTEEEILKAIGWERAEMYMKLTPNFPVAEAKKETLKNARAVERAHGIGEQP